MKTRIAISMLFASFSLSAFTQFSISGKTQDELGNPIISTKIEIKSLKKRTYSDETGTYQMNEIPPGKYEIYCSAFEYEEIRKTIDVHSNTELNFVLKQDRTLLVEEVSVVGIRAEENTPTTFTNLSAKEIEKINYGQDLPFILSTLPSSVASSDAGSGIGYTNLKIRGVDPTRTNVTIDGIPYNDAETQDVFWVNLPDLSSSMESIQIQRGVGTSTNGSSAFGASINISTDVLHKKPYAVIDQSYGSFNSWKTSISAGTGLLSDRFTLDTRLSSIESDGYIDRATTNLKSFFMSAAYRGGKSTLRLNIFSGKEKTYQAWYGSPESRIRNDEEGMLDYALRNGLSDEQTNYLLEGGRTYNAYTYENETDNYQQSHFHLHYDYRFNSLWKLKIGLHYTKGKGYFENFYGYEDFSNFGFTPIIVNNDTISNMDLVRQMWLDNHFFGKIFNVNYNNKKGLELNLGGGINRYLGDHFDKVAWGEFLTQEQREALYFENKSDKIDANIYLKANYQIKKFNLFADVQYRHIDYSFIGIDEQNGVISDMTHRVLYDFLNPKIGLSYRINNSHSLYASYAIANREPVRDDFRGKTIDNKPASERLYNLEAGYHLKLEKGYLNGNIYHMLYDNQLVLTGEINDVGGYTRSNVKDSYRYGLELEGGIIILNQLSINANLNLSQNKILNFTEYIDAFDENWNPLPQTKIEYQKTDLAFSPNIIAGLSISYQPISQLFFTLSNQYVGKQYLDNTSNSSRIINDYFVSHFDVSYSFSFWKIKEMTVGGRINNLFNSMFENNGYTYSYLYNTERIQENFYYPQAGINFMLRLVIKL